MPNSTKYSPQDINDIKRFIAFYEAIPANKWCENAWINDAKQSYALGHLGVRDTDSLKFSPDAARLLTISCGKITAINDGKFLSLEWGITPKARVINYLKSLLPK